ncbi:hypothetical protein ACIHDR_43580 [Nocardia sp. NPDC052278]|uniref:hypothetical protein n=1 Tax=unclassified Nocardia TaxID=2637762 RepID=UPI0036BAB89F
MSRRGRKAALPSTGTSPARGILGESLVVRCFAQDGSEHKDFDFARLPMAPAMQQELAVAFARRTAGGSRMTAISSMQSVFGGDPFVR